MSKAYDNFIKRTREIKRDKARLRRERRKQREKDGIKWITPDGRPNILIPAEKKDK